MRSVTHRAIAIAMFAFAGVVATAAPQAADPRTLGPKIGEPLPPFTLPDQNGVPRSLRSLLGPKGAVLVFFRSADW